MQVSGKELTVSDLHFLLAYQPLQDARHGRLPVLGSLLAVMATRGDNVHREVPLNLKFGGVSLRLSSEEASAA
jgi:hypothetical protein